MGIKKAASSLQTDDTAEGGERQSKYLFLFTSYK
jgi:hypothetical protein